MNAKQYIDAVEHVLRRRLTDDEQRKLARLYQQEVSVGDAIAMFGGGAP